MQAAPKALKEKAASPTQRCTDCGMQMGMKAARR